MISFAGSAAAVDGVIEINETSVTTGSITPGDLPGYPATLTQPGSDRLTSNLDLPSSSTTGILVANFFEIVDPSKLVYDTRRGLVEHDSGSGPPSGNVNRGWVRTGGRDVGGNVDVVGFSQCNRWADNTGNEFGSTAYLAMNATGDDWPWTLETFDCSFELKAWCIEDH